MVQAGPTGSMTKTKAIEASNLTQRQTTPTQTTTAGKNQTNISTNSQTFTFLQKRTMSTQTFETAENTNDYTPVARTPAEIVPEVDFTALLNKSQGLEKLETVLTLTAEYMELEKPGETFRGIFVGFYDMNITDKTTGEQRIIQGARFLANKQVFVNAGVVLVNELKRGNTAVGTALEILYLRKEGNTKIYQISLLG